MLRYQLNPHFLFNTLNAISTLVLTKAVDPANEMVTKLSKFLRYSLEHSPFDRVSWLKVLFSRQVASGGDAYTVSVGGYSYSNAYIQYDHRSLIQ